MRHGSGNSSAGSRTDRELRFGKGEQPGTIFNYGPESYSGISVLLQSITQDLNSPSTLG